jgi:hypothetical protein
MPLPPFGERLFPIQNDYDFRTGVCADGRQVLMGPWFRSVVAFFFDAEGHLLGEEEHTNVLREPLDYERANPEIERWQRELGCQTATIHVRQFWVEHRDVGISDGLDLFEDEPGMTPEELAENAASRQGWVESGCFVFNWGKDYHMSATGVVVST